MKEEISVLVNRLESEGQKTITFFTGFPTDQNSRKIYPGDKGWELKDILAHFISAEKSFLLLFENIRTGGQGADTDFNIDKYNNLEVEKLRIYSMVDLVREFSSTRKQMIEFVERLNGEDLLKVGNHPAMGQSKLVDMIRMVYIHNSRHIRDISQSFIQE